MDDQQRKEEASEVSTTNTSIGTAPSEDKDTSSIVVNDDNQANNQNKKRKREDTLITETNNNSQEGKNANSEPIDVFEGLVGPMDDFVDELPTNEKRRKRQRKKKDKTKTISAPPENTSVIFSNLPLNITEEEFIALARKAGLIKQDLGTGALKILLYKDENGKNKGDGRVTYFKTPSVQLAKLLLDESEYPVSSGNIIKVKESEFQPENDLDTNTKRGSKTKKGGGLKLDQNSQLGWEDFETRRHVIIQGMFNPSEARSCEDGEDQFYIDLKAEIIEEVAKSGPIEIVKVFEGHPDGVVSVKFRDGDSAAKCIEKINGRWFDKRLLKAFWYDGFKDYSVQAQEAKRMIVGGKERVVNEHGRVLDGLDVEEEKRLERFGDWLDNQSSSEEEEPVAPLLEEDEEEDQNLDQDDDLSDLSS